MSRQRSLTYDEETGLAVPQVALLMVFLTIFIDTLAATISTPALPYYAKEFHADNAHIGYLFAAWGFTSTFCAPVLSHLSDRIGRRKILLLSLFGAGLANIGQATAPSYWVLFAWRAFSGVWAAVGSSAQVYLADVCTPAVLPDYMAKLSSVPGAAMTFGPGLGGGLSTFGLNVPILADGCLSFAAAALVFAYLPESPQWLSGQKKKADDAAPASATVTKVPKAVYVLDVSSFLWGISFGTRVSMMVVALNAKLGFNALQVGYLYVSFALVMLCQNFWVTPWLQRRFGLYAVAVVGTLGAAIFNLSGFVLAQGMWCCLVCLTISNSASALRIAASGPICAGFTDSTNRGKVFGQVQMLSNLGRMTGSLVGGHLANTDPVRLPWLFSASCACLSAVLLLLIWMAPQPPQPQEKPEPTGSQLPRGFTGLGGTSSALDDEVGSTEDYERMGRFLGELLTQRHYRWVSKQDAVLQLVDGLLPELRASGTGQYEDLTLLWQHAQHTRNELHRLGDREL